MPEHNHHEPKMQTSHSWGALSPAEKAAKQQERERRDECRLARQGWIVLIGMSLPFAIGIGSVIYFFLK